MYNYNDLFNNIKDSLEDLSIQVHTDEVYHSEIVTGYINMLSKLKKLHFHPSDITIHNLSLFSLLPSSVEILQISKDVLYSKINNNGTNSNVKTLILLDSLDPTYTLNLHKHFPNIEILTIYDSDVIILKDLLKCEHLSQLVINNRYDKFTYTFQTRIEIIDFINKNQSTSSMIISSPLTYGS